MSAFVYTQNPEAYVRLADPVTMRDTLVANSLRRGSTVDLYLTIDVSKLPEKE